MLNPVTVVTPDMPVVLDRGEPMLTTRTTIGLTRATLLRLLAALAALALVAAACGGDDDGDGDTAVEDDGGDTADDASGDGSADDDEGGDAVAPTIPPSEDEPVDDGEVQTGGVLRVALEADGDGINPAANNFATAASLIGRTLFDPLFAIDENGNWIPYLAAGAAPVEGTNSWQITLREGVTYHDGSIMSADDVITGFNTTINDPIISLAILPSFPPENRIEKIDDLTVQFNLIRPSAHFPVNLASQLGLVPSAAYLEAAAADPTLDQMPVGQGPFKIVSRTQDDKTVIERFDDYTVARDEMLKKTSVPHAPWTIARADRKRTARIGSWEAIPRINHAVAFEWQPKTWYRLKLTVRQEGENAIIEGKVWKRDEKEPEKPTLTFKDPNPNKNGAAALYGFVTNTLATPNVEGYEGSELYYDNVEITPNK